MTECEQRVSIAKWIGWKIKHSPTFNHLCRPGEETGVCCGKHLTDSEIFDLFLAPNECGPGYVIPDYTRDLNAIHKAEMNLTFENRIVFVDNLRFILREPHPEQFIMEVARLASAKANIRAEALLRTLDLWK